MGNGIPPKLPTTESEWERSQLIIDNLEAAMLEQQKKELSEGKLKTAITRANNHGYDKTNTELVGEAESLLELVKHKFSEVKVNEYKEKWERAEADKDPEGEVFKRLKEEAEEEIEKSLRRKRPETKFNLKSYNRTDCIVKVSNLPPDATEEMIRSHFEADEKHSGNFIRYHIIVTPSNICTGSAYLEYPDTKEHERALTLNNSILVHNEAKIKISVKNPEAIPTPPAAPTVLRCVNFKVDGVCRSVRTHFLPAFGSLFKAPVSEQNVKDRTAVLEYIEVIKKIEDVVYFPSGSSILHTNPLQTKPKKFQKGILSLQERSKICTICCGLESDHSNCLRSFAMAKASIGE